MARKVEYIALREALHRRGWTISLLSEVDGCAKRSMTRRFHHLCGAELPWVLQDLHPTVRQMAVWVTALLECHWRVATEAAHYARSGWFVEAHRVVYADWVGRQTALLACAPLVDAKPDRRVIPAIETPPKKIRRYRPRKK